MQKCCSEPSGPCAVQSQSSHLPMLSACCGVRLPLENIETGGPRVEPKASTHLLEELDLLCRAQGVKMELALQSSNCWYPKRPKTSRLNGKASLSQVVAKRLLAWSEVKHMVRALENTMEMHLLKVFEVSNGKCKPTGSSNTFRHLKGRGVEISPWMVLADWVIATSQTKLMCFSQQQRNISGKNGRKETSTNDAHFFMKQTLLTKTGLKESFDATQGTEVVEDLVNTALGNDKPPGRSGI